MHSRHPASLSNCSIVKLLYHKYAVALVTVLSTFWVIGCSPGVREDRTIEYSSDGNAVAFQHGDEGVYVASPDGQLQKIFNSTAVLASSSPLWSPIDKRLVFTTLEPPPDAASLDGSTNTTSNDSSEDWEAHPDGRPFFAGQMQYTCWLRAAPSPGGTVAEPVSLFTARCNHSGYVAANLAIRWHPSGQQILFVDQVDESKMGLFVFDLQTSTKQQVSKSVAQAIVFSTSPRGKYLSIGKYGSANGVSDDGLWLLPTEQLTTPAQEWWHVQEATQIPFLGQYEPLEALRRWQPVWSLNEEKLAISLSSPSTDRQNIDFEVVVAQPSTGAVKPLVRLDGPPRDLRWHPNGKNLGFVEGPPIVASRRSNDKPLLSKLKIVDESGAIFEPLANLQQLADTDVRKFAGWNASGEQMALITPIPLAEYDTKWCLLFPAIPSARDRVWLFDVRQNPPQAQLVHEGLRITFPNWSPVANQLSLWGTFTPSHRSWLSIAVPWSLRPGDPAAILDVETGQLSWLAVSPHEESQVGHYYLLKQDYVSAWDWYDKGSQGRVEPQPQPLQNLWSRSERLTQDPWFFEYYCLLKLGRLDEAQARLANYRKSLTFSLPKVTETDDDLMINGLDLRGIDLRDETLRKEVQSIIDLLTLWIQSSIAAETFLSLNATADGITFFQKLHDEAPDATERFVAGVCLTQLLLADGANARYASFTTSELLPDFEKLAGNSTLNLAMEAPHATNLAAWRQQAERICCALMFSMNSLPLASEEFQTNLNETQVRELLPIWVAAAERSALPLDVVVAAMLERLGEDSSGAIQAATAKQNPLAGSEFKLETPQQVDLLITQLSQMFEELAQF